MRIGLCGTINVGKTTLVNLLKDIPEFKDYKFATERSKYLRDLGVTLNTDSTLLGQNLFLGERSSELMNENIITDRTIIDIMAFTLSAQSISKEDKDAFINYTKRFITQYDYIFYVSPLGVKIEDNGVRCIDSDYRNQIDLTIKHLINENLHLIKNFGIISGTVEDRIKQVKSYLDF